MAKSIQVLVIGDASSVSRAFAQAGASASAFGSKMEGVGTKMQSVGKAMTIGLTLPIVAGAALAVKAFANFEESLNSFEAVSGATGDQMERVSDLAKKLGNDLTLPGASAADAAEAMTELAKGGLSVEDAMDAAKATIQLATAAEIENAAAATILADALNAFGLKGKDAARVADLLAASANATTATIDDMALALKASGAVAAQLGIPIEDLTTAIGLMANAGIKGSDAGTSLKTMMLSLAAPTEKAAAVMNDLGLKVFDASGKMLPLPAIIDNWRRATEGLSQAQEIQAMKTIFGTDAIRAAQVVLDSAPGAWDKLAAAVTKEGAAADLASAKSKGVSGAIDALKSSLETAAISFGEILAPAVTAVANKISALANAFNELSPAAQKAIGIGALIVAALGPIVYVVGTIVKAFAGLKIAMSALAAHPVVAVAAAVVALGLAFQQAYQHSETFRRGVEAVIDLGKRMAASLIDAIADIIDGFSTMVGLFDWIPGVGDDLAGLADKASSAADALRGTADGLRDSADAASTASASMQSMAAATAAAGDHARVATGQATAFAGVMQGALTAAGNAVAAALNSASGKTDIFGNRMPVAGGKVRGLAKDADSLTSSVNKIPDKHATNVTTPGAVDSKNKADNVNTAVRRIPDKSNTRVSTSGTGGAIGQLNAVASAVRAIDTSVTIFVNTVVSGVTGVIGGQHGLTNYRGGLAMVGEAGPELVVLPPGSDVIPNPQTDRILSGVHRAQEFGVARGGGPTVIVNVAGSVTSSRDLALEIRDELSRLSMYTPTLWGGR
jgi:TP901 family phage tail tape measure protein